MATDPAPFPDLDVPPRTPEQKDEDRKRNREQTDMLAGKTSARSATQQRVTHPDGKDELFRLLERRRSDAGPNVVRFASVPTDSRRWSLVVPDELLVRNDGLSAEARTNLETNFDPQPPAAADSGICRELATKLTVYRHKGRPASRNNDMRTVMSQLGSKVDGQPGGAPGGPSGGSRVQASPHLVVALHRIPPGIVAKAAVGPAPTQVDASDESFLAAGHRKPQGKIVVAVIDTGIAEASTRTDGWLDEVRRTPGAQGNIDPLDRFPLPKNGYLDFAAGHGTFAAGIVRLVDRDARIKVYRALDSDGFASELDIACAMIQAVKDGADVLNLSVGMRTVDDRPSVAFELALDAIDEIVARRKREAPAIVVSAGNYGDNRPVWPAAFTGRVISVAALNTRMQGAGWSSRGPWVTCSCIGQGVVSTFVPGDEDPKFGKHHPPSKPDHYPQDAWAVWSGTSFAAPQVAGAISRMMREKGIASPRRAAQRLLQRGTSTPNFGRALRLLPGTRS